MKHNRLEDIFEHQGFGVAWFSAELKLVKCSLTFEIFSRSRSAEPQAFIGDVIPETVGLEEILGDLQTGKERHFSLENINRKWHGGQKLFFNVYFYAYEDHKTPLICLVKEVTAEGREVQKIKQEKYETQLLEGLIDARQRILSENIIGDSRPLREVRNLLEKISHKRPKTALFLGETGTGKSLAARAIHLSLDNPNVPFIEINAAAVQEAQLESELFGYEKGAFSGAVSDRRGLIEDADGGFLFLDEVGEISPSIQAKLISYLETGKYRRLGSREESEVQTCLITATNRNLDEMVKEGRFREDLLLRLNVFKLTFPPLRVLDEDILTIARHFVDVNNTELKKKVLGFTESAERALLSHLWPGNVRELANCIERAMIFADRERIDSHDLLLPPC